MEIIILELLPTRYGNWKDLCVSGKCLYFDGSGDYVTRATDTDFDFSASDSFTLTGWFRHKTSTSGTDVILARHNSTAGGFKLLMESDGDITCGIDRDSTFTPEDFATSTAATYDDNQWHFVSCVKSTTTSLTLYIDGNQVAQDSSIASTGTYANNDALYLGIDGDGSSNGFEGFLDDFKIYRSALTSSQQKAEMNNRGTVRGAAAQIGQSDTSFLNDGLVGYWPMDEPAANSCTGGSNDNCDKKWERK